MPERIPKTSEGESIGGSFSNRENVVKAIEAFQDMVIQLDDTQVKEAYTHLLVGRGFSKSQQVSLDKPIRATPAPG